MVWSAFRPSGVCAQDRECVGWGSGGFGWGETAEEREARTSRIWRGFFRFALEPSLSCTILPGFFFCRIFSSCRPRPNPLPLISGSSSQPGLKQRRWRRLTGGCVQGDL